MDERLRNLVNELWDREVEKQSSTEEYNTHETVVARALGLTKMQVLHARRGYRRAEAKRPAHLREVNQASNHTGYCSTTFLKTVVTMPRVSLLERHQPVGAAA